MSAELRTDGARRAGWIGYALALLLIAFGIAHDLPPVWTLIVGVPSSYLGYRPGFNCAGADGTCTVPAVNSRGKPAILPGSPADKLQKLVKA